jgi:L-cysteine S-thiosulfotransferase
LINLAKSPNCSRQPSLHSPWRRAWLGSAGLMLALIGFSSVNTAAAQGVSEQGFRIMNAGNSGNCIACHTLPGQTGIVSTFGPALDKVASRYTSDELRQWVSDARKLKPDTLMPPFGTTAGTHGSVRSQPMLNEEQIAHVVAALLTLK